jgi:hypothetical protein
VRRFRNLPARRTAIAVADSVGCFRPIIARLDGRRTAGIAIADLHPSLVFRTPIQGWIERAKPKRQLTAHALQPIVLKADLATAPGRRALILAVDHLLQCRCGIGRPFVGSSDEPQYGSQTLLGTISVLIGKSSRPIRVMILEGIDDRIVLRAHPVRCFEIERTLADPR